MARAGNTSSLAQKLSAFSEMFSENPRQLIDFLFPQRPDEKQAHRLQRLSRALRVTPRKAQSIYYNEPRAKNEDAYLFIIIRAKIEMWTIQNHDEAERHQAASFARFHDLWGSLFDEKNQDSRSHVAVGSQRHMRASRASVHRRIQGAL